jgi:hypothetical protein
MRLPTRLALIGLLLLVAIGGGFAALSGSKDQGSLVSEDSIAESVIPNWVEGPCLEDGVTLVVDFGTDAQLDSLVRCAIGFEGSGWDLFAATEIPVAGTKQYPIGFVCRINNYPDLQTQDCNDTPSYMEGSWSYFLKTSSEISWKVSGIGSASREPLCGEVEGWRFLQSGEGAMEFQPSEDVGTFACGK